MAARKADVADLAQTHAVRFRVRDMTNGVTRVESPSLVLIDEARELSDSGEWAPMMFPHPKGMFDAGMVALEALGISAEAARQFVCEAIVRAVDEDVVEVVCWSKN